MIKISDYFFQPYITPQQQRRNYVARNSVQHSSDIAPSDPQPEQAVQLSIETDASLPIDRVAVYFTTDGAEPGGERGQALHGQVVLAQIAGAGDARTAAAPTRRWHAQIPGQADGALVRYRIDAWSSSDATQRWVADVFDPFTSPAPAGREFAYHVDRRVAPDWTHDAIVYHIFVDRFASAHDQPPIRSYESLTEFYGGTIRGVTEQLDYLTALGVNCLWLSPIMESPTYHSYNPSSYYDVSSRFGTNDDLRALITAAHARGMRVILDFVANHTSNEHPSFIAAQQGDALLANSWYTFNPAYRNGYLTFFDVPEMPILKTDQQPVRDYLIEAARHWLSDFGADGLRLDNVSGPTHAFWTFFQEGVKQTHPDALTLGEVSGDMRDIAAYAGRIDASMDFPMAREIRQVFALRETPLDGLLAMLAEHDASFPALMSPARILDNHDMHRFLWVAENDTRRLKLALTFLLSLTGIPILYYGTEVGLSQREGAKNTDPYAREPMPWGDRQQADVLAYTRWLIRQRSQRASLRRGRMTRVPLAQAQGAEGQVGALVRWNDFESTIVVFNNGETPARCSIDQRHLPFSWEGDALVEAHILTPDGILPLDASAEPLLTCALPPLSAAMFLLRAKFVE